MPEIDARLKASWSQLFSPQEISFAPEVLDSYRVSNPLLPPGRPPLAVIKPRNAFQLQALVRWANEIGLGLVPVSSRAPHTRGGILCEQEHVLVDLAHWKKIDLIDRRNRVCRVEPGVTYDELLPVLSAHGMTVAMPLAPRRGKSVLAAVLDREPTTWPNKQWDACDPLASSEVIFGTGEIFRTGAAGGPGTIDQQRAAGGALKAPMGPSQTDFHRLVQGAQGSMGIVTWITIRCEVRPTIQKPYLLAADELPPLIGFIYQVQRSQLGEHCLVLDHNAAAALISRGKENIRKKLCASLPRYICLQNIAGFERLPQERLDYQVPEIASRATDNGLVLSENLAGIHARDFLAAAVSPAEEKDWRRGPTGGCLSLFFLTTLDRVPKFITVFEQLLPKYALSVDAYGLYLQPMVQNHCCQVEFLVFFEVEKSLVDKLGQLEKEAVSALSEQGAFFSRPYGAAASAAFARNRLYHAVLQKVKKIFDPHGILNPGKFGLCSHPGVGHKI